MAVPSVSYTEYTFREREAIQISITDSVGGILTVEAKPSFLSEDGTFLIGTMPEGKEETFEVEIRADG